MTTEEVKKEKKQFIKPQIEFLSVDEATTRYGEEFFKMIEELMHEKNEKEIFH